MYLYISMILLLSSCIHYTEKSRREIIEENLNQKDLNVSVSKIKINFYRFVDATEQMSPIVLDKFNRILLNHFCGVSSYFECTQAEKDTPGGGAFEFSTILNRFDIQKNLSPIGLIKTETTRYELEIIFRLTHLKTNKDEYYKKKIIIAEDGSLRVNTKGHSLKDLSEALVDVLEKDFKDIVKSVYDELRFVSEKYRWEGRVAYLQGHRVYLNIGQKSGLQKGDILQVTELGEEVFDPQNGRFIGRTPGKVKGTVEVIDFFGEDGAIAIIHSGGGFKENDRVEVFW